ncbi:MAG: flotillin-like FloA family protein, partial [Myxococcales bacterium]|nr:flotillin-like FloA family protein [Myxococcales bacterium]
MTGPIVIIALVVVFMFLFFYFIPVGLWIAAKASGAGVSIFTLVGMRLRRVSPAAIVNPRISVVKAGLDISVQEL